jgi:hypothetical protein
MKKSTNLLSQLRKIDISLLGVQEEMKMKEQASVTAVTIRVY